MSKILVVTGILGRGDNPKISPMKDLHQWQLFPAFFVFVFPMNLGQKLRQQLALGPTKGDDRPCFFCLWDASETPALGEHVRRNWRDHRSPFVGPKNEIALLPRKESKTIDVYPVGKVNPNCWVFSTGFFCQTNKSIFSSWWLNPPI